MSSYSLEEYPVLQRWTGRSRLALMIVSFISGVMTFRGLKAYGMGGSEGLFNSFFGPLLLTSVSVLVALFGYAYVFERYPLTKTPQERNRLHLVILFISVVLLSTSTWFSLVGLASSRCLERSLRSGLMDAERVFDELVTVRRMEKSLLVPLQLGAGQSDILKKSERDGSLSGTKGLGKVVANIRGLRRGYEDIAGTLESSIVSHENAATEGQIILEDIRGILNDSDLDVSKKSAMIVPLFNALNAQLAELQLSAVPSVLSSVQSVDDLYLSRGPYMDSVLDAIKKPVEKTKQEILKQVTRIRRQKEPVVPRFHVIDAEQAIFEYPEAVWASLVYAVSLDIGFPLMCLSFLYLLGRRETTMQTVTRGWSHGTSQSFGVTNAGAQSQPGHGFLWNTNPAANRQGNQPRTDTRDKPQPPAA